MLNRLDKWITNASRRLNWVSGVALVLMMALVFINVILRTVWQPILGTYEFTAFLASVTISFALAHCATLKGHVAISLFTDRLRRKNQAIVEAVVAVIGTVLFMVMAWQTTLYAMVIRRSGEVALTTELPFFPFIFGVAFGFAMLALVNLTDLYNAIKKIVA